MIKFMLTTALVLPVTLSLSSIAMAQQGSQKPTAASQQSVGQCPDHFASLDADKNNRISQQEERAVRTKVFDSLDENNDSIVSREEYVKCLISTPAFAPAAVGQGGSQTQAQNQGSLLGISDKRMEKNFKQVDANNDGKITWKEYMAAAKAEHAKSANNASQPSSASASAGWAFARMDSNLDGELTMKEWTNLSDPQSFADTSFKAIDQNGDGKISKQEYDSMANKRYKGASGSETAKSPNQKAAGDDLDVWDYEIWL